LTFVEPFFLFVLLPLAVTAFYVVRRFASSTAALAVIVAASLVFYAPYGAPAMALLIVSLSINLFIGILLTRDAPPTRHRGALLALGLAFNFGALVTFKYLDQIEHLARPSAAPILALAIPAGISFYTFHQAVFLRDAFRRQPDVLAMVGAARGLAGRVSRLVRYAAFVAFFPQLVIGPITYMSEFGPQIRREGFGRLKATNIQVGMTLIIVGLFKKLCLADLLALRVDPVFDSLTRGEGVTQAQAALAILGYFFQLYFDFSGYSDIALGIARLFGIRLPINFDSPLRATGIVDFYRRWHITLTRVIVLFVFTPLSLSGARFAIRRGYRDWRLRALSAWVPFVANFQLIALWHGAKYTFVVFGLIHGLWYVLETEVRRTGAFKAYRRATSDRLRTIAGMAVTALPLMLTFALFRSESLAVFGRLIATVVGKGLHPGAPLALALRDWAPVAAAALIVYFLPNIYEVLRRYRPGIRAFTNASNTPALLRAAWRPTLAWSLFLIVLGALAYTRLNYRAPFLYGGF
jgi:alginate O-acetyltransferase complex protein AlgI